jgi:hypothetical protein
MDENNSVVFAEENAPVQAPYEERSKIVDSVIALSGGLVRTKEQANYALLGFVALAFGISLFLLFNDSEPTMPRPPQSVLDQMPGRR